MCVVPHSVDKNESNKQSSVTRRVKTTSKTGIALQRNAASTVAHYTLLVHELQAVLENHAHLMMKNCGFSLFPRLSSLGWEM